MPIKQKALNKLLHKLWDICLTVIAFIGAYFIKKHLLPDPFRGLTESPNYYIVLLMIIIIWYATFSLFNLYTPYRKQTFVHIFGNMIKAVATATFILIVCAYIFKIMDVSRIMMGLFVAFDISLLALSKWLACRIISSHWRKESNFKNILIIGSRERARDVISAIENHLDAGYMIMGCLEVDKGEIGKEVKNGINVIGTVDSLKELLLQQVVDELIIAMPLREIENADEYFTITEEIGVSIHIVPDWQLHYLMYRPSVAAISFEKFLGIPTMTISSTPFNYSGLLIKQTFDFVFAAFGMLLLLPVFILIACAIKLSSPGPVFFKQERCGINGRKFMVYKFRTMVAGAEAKRQELDALDESDGPVFKIKKDPRIIPFVGTSLRKTSLDELPQLINIIKGEMSLIGPRPPIPAEVNDYEIWQRRRLSMKPGITCLWQISPNRNEMNFKKWMAMDLSYIDTWSLLLDFKIFLKTIQVMLTGRGR